jgi:hypothetical protein
MLHHSPTAKLDNDVNNDPDGDSDFVVVVVVAGSAALEMISFVKHSEDRGVLLDHNPVVAVVPTTSMGTASNPQLATNIVISFVGAGILGLPNAFAIKFLYTFDGVGIQRILYVIVTTNTTAGATAVTVSTT